MQILDELDSNMDVTRIAKEQRDKALRAVTDTHKSSAMPENSVHGAVLKLAADLTDVQGLLHLRLNGKPVPQPQVASPSSFFLRHTSPVLRASMLL